MAITAGAKAKPNIDPVGGGYLFKLTAGPSGEEMDRIFAQTISQESVRRSSKTVDEHIRVRAVFLATYAGLDFRLAIVVSEIVTHPSIIGAYLFGGYVDRAYALRIDKRKGESKEMIASMCGIISIGVWSPAGSSLGLASGGLMSVAMVPKSKNA